MHTLIFILSVIVIYPILGTVISFVLSIYNSDNIKFEVALFTYGLPIINGLLLYLIFPNNFQKNIWWVVIYSLAILIRDILRGRDRFLLKLTFTGDQISIKYINSIFQLKSVEFKISEGYKASLSTRKTLFDYPATLKIVFEENSREYIVFTKNIWTSSCEALNSVNIQLLAGQAGGTLEQPAANL